MADQKTEKKARMMSAIMKINSQIGKNLDLEESSQILLEELVTVAGCSGCAILQIEEDKVRIMAERNFLKIFREQQFNADMPVIRHVLDRRQSFCAGDVLNGPAAECIPAASPIKSLICVPVMINTHVKGLIYLHSEDKDAFDEDDLHFVEWLAREISITMERTFLHSQVKALSMKDGLTGCFNRKRFEEDVDGEMARAKRYEKPLSLLMVDIDWFKNYNEFHGDFLGDTVLKKVAEICKINLRVIDKVYRYGGEEFIILLPETGKWRALSVAKRLHKIIEQERFEGEKDSQPDKRITVSIGVASYPWDGHCIEELLGSVESALDRAKHSGKNTVCAFDPVGVSASISEPPLA
jgi:diguanylate cyclase (GGDEF)-like protein